MSHNLYNNPMSKITKQIFSFLFCVVFAFGCTTTHTRKLISYTDQGYARTPIVSYHSNETTTTTRKSSFRENSFWLFKTVRKSEVGLALYTGIFGVGFLIDLISMPVVIFTHTTDTDVEYDTS